MAALVAILAGFAFGGADQYLGSRSALGDWASSLSLMSAPWLALPFAVGLTQRRPGRALALGLVATAAALAGYFVLTLSPFENVPLARFLPGLAPLIEGQRAYILGGLVTGPLYGWLGHRWRWRRSWSSAALVAGAFMLEPLVRSAAGRLLPPAAVWDSEQLFGLLLAVAFLAAGISHRRSLQASSGG